MDFQDSGDHSIELQIDIAASHSPCNTFTPGQTEVEPPDLCSAERNGCDALAVFLSLRTQQAEDDWTATATQQRDCDSASSNKHSPLETTRSPMQIRLPPLSRLSSTGRRLLNRGYEVSPVEHVSVSHRLLDD
mmetsp:Transcript_61481/g.107127  ORF Transcript_61481/g.107127 Transcript_61481/m.107127 type:complete len:133 (+) Transcript_61481:2-400(+)